MHTFRKITLALFCVLTLSAYAQEKIMVTQNVPYDEHKSCVLDVAQPISSSKELRIKQKNGKSIYGIISLPQQKA